MTSKLNPDPSASTRANAADGLSLEDTIAQQLRGVARVAKSKTSGYNPYDMAPSSPKTAGNQKPTDLRKLSEWIRLTRQVAALNKDKPQE
jgi:hypothetical protein